MTLHPLQLFADDVAPLGLLSAPFISWCGSAGLGLFFLWQASRLYLQATQSAQPFARVALCLARLVHERQLLDQTNTAYHPTGTGTNKTPDTATQFDQRDGADLRLLDTTFQREPRLAQAWKQYRKTLVTEQVAWYIEPRIFSSRSAQELFSLETIFRGRLNLAWYQQVPSLLTGVGLLLTFIALLVGLSKLHADGHGITGIQGLINGLAGKFLTSIVGLTCATLFTLIEKPLMFRLLSAHQHCTHLIDDVFPRKSLEQILEGLSGAPRRPHAIEQPARYPGGMPFAQPAPDVLTQPLKAMTQSVDALTREIRTHLLDEKSSPITIPADTIAEAFAPVIQQLTTALNQATRQSKVPPDQPSPSARQVDHLVDDLTSRITRSAHPALIRPARQSTGWFQKLRGATHLDASLSAVTQNDSANHTAHNAPLLHQ